MVNLDLIGCIECGAARTVVTDSRPTLKLGVRYTRRKRECVKCNAKYWTKEVIDQQCRPYLNSKEIML